MFVPNIIAITEEGEEVYSTSASTREYFKADVSLNQDELQKNLEEKQLLEFIKVLKRERSRYSFTDFKRGETDPPDFLIVRKKKKIGLELTVITNEQRNSVASKLAIIKDYFRGQYESGKFQGIQNLYLTMELKGKIPRKLDSAFEAKLSEVADFIDGLHIPPNFWEESRNFLTQPDSAPYPLDEIYTSANIIVRVTTVSDIHRTELQNQIGFNLDIDYQLDYGREGLQRLLNEKVARKDILENQELLIIVGGPNQRGIGNIDEASALYYFLSKSLIKLDKPTYLQRVFILLWPLSKHYLFDFDRKQNYFRFEKKRRRRNAPISPC